MVELLNIDGAAARLRLYVYVAMFAVLFLSAICLGDSSWHGDIELHTLMEAVATVLSLVTGCIALVRYYSRKSNTFLLIGTGFVATGFLDGYHAVVSSSRFIETFPSSPPSLIAWSWFSSRMFLSLLLWLSWLLWRRADRLGAASRVSEHLVYAVVTISGLACYAVFAFVQMPAAYNLLLFFPRPQEFVPALFLALALLGYSRKGKWKSDVFEHWLVLSLIVGLMAQAMFMSLSGRLYDVMFNMAHLLKIGSYVCVLVGLLFSMQRLVRESLVRRELAHTNAILITQQEVSPDGILVVDERARIISYNRRFVDLWGLPKAMVLARLDKPVLQLVASQVREPEAFLARVKYLYEHRIDESHEEIGLRDGRIIDRHSAPMIGDGGEYYGRVWFFRDITRRKQAEEGIIDEKLFSNTLIASLPDGFCVFDAAGRLVRWNARMSDALGFSGAQLAAVPDMMDIVQEADRPAVAQTIQRVFDHGSGTVDAHLLTTTGIRYFSLKATRADTPKGAYLIGVATDITERTLAQSKLKRSDAHLVDAQRISHVGSWEQDHATGTGNWSAEAFRIFERDPASCVASFEEFLALVHPDDRLAFEEGFMRTIREHTSYDIEHRLLMKDGRVKYVREQCSTTYDEQGQPAHTVGTIQDITLRILAEGQIKLFRTLIDSAPDEIHVVDPESLRIIDANESGWVKLGYTREELLALHVPEIDMSDPSTKRAIAEQLLKDGTATIETYHRRKDGSIFPVEVTLRIITLDRPYSVAIARDITERKRVEEVMRKMQAQLRDQAVRDPLTGLYNRRYLDETMERELLRAERYGQRIGIVMCDLDLFKTINDSFGHLAGDEVLRVFAELLQRHTRGSDIACRYGGEEFLLLLFDALPSLVHDRAEQLRTELGAKRISFGGVVIRVTASFGLAAFPEDGKTADELIRAADEAMYAAKEAGRNRVVATSSNAGPPLAA